MNETIESRPTPFGLIFGDAGFAAQFQDIRAQEELREADTPDVLLLLPAAGTVLRDLLPADAAPNAHAEVVKQTAAVVFHAYRFWRGGRQIYQFTEPALRSALVTAVGATSIGVPGSSGYVQLTRNLMWGRVAEDAAPEPVDGFFWSACAHVDGGMITRLDLLFALGVRADRPGMSTVDITVMPADLSQWARASARPDDVDFANVLPGGELKHYHALTTRAEAIKLAALCFARIQQQRGGAKPAELDGDVVHSIDG